MTLERENFTLHEDIFFIDTKGSGEKPRATKKPVVEVENDSGSVWKDEDDEKIEASLVSKPRLMKLREEVDETEVDGKEYQRRLKKVRSSLIQTPKWAEAARQTAQMGGDDDISYKSGDLDHLLNRPGTYSNNVAKTPLIPDYLSISKMMSVKVPNATANCLETVEYHPKNSSILLTSGLDKNLHIFHAESANVGGECLFSARLSDLTITKSAFIGDDGGEIVSVGRRPFFYRIDVAREQTTRIAGIRGSEERSWKSFCTSPCGKYLFLIGNEIERTISMICARTKQLINTFRSNEVVKAVCCSQDSNHLFSVGESSLIYIWDLKSLRCIQTIRDDGGVCGNALAVSPDSSLLACGSTAGIVNVYNLTDILSGQSSSSPTPLKSFSNLITPISGIAFHPSSHLMVFWSSEKRNSLRFVHFPTGRIYQNWPTERSPLGRVASVSFNCVGDRVAFGRRDGIVQIYNLNHFSQSYNSK